MANPNTINISRRRCKPKFRPLRGQVKSRHPPERIDLRRQCFYHLYKYLEIIDRKLGQPFWIMLCICYYIFNKIILDLDLDNSYWIRKTPNFATNNINILCFYKPHIIWPRKVELAKVDCITNCLPDNSSTFILF